MTTQRYYSNIYWHFTGSPKGIDWRRVRRPADIADHGPVLDAAAAVQTLGAILASRQLRATCTERVVGELETDKFCCVTDIPLKDLPSHAPYYGRVAIGFKAPAVHKSFLPVMYVPLQRMPATETTAPNRQLAATINDLLAHGTSFSEQQAMKLMALAANNKEAVREPDAKAMKGFLTNFIKVTDFHASPEETFYREREWRNIGPFVFAAEDVAAVVVPEAFVAEARSHLAENRYPGSISVLAWEFVEQA